MANFQSTILTDSITVDIPSDQQPSPWQSFKFGRPGNFANYTNDFFSYAAGDWTVTTVGVGGTQALSTTVKNGVLVLTNSAGIADSTALQLLGGYIPTAGKRIIFETKLNISDATKSKFFAGMAATVADIVANATVGAIGFRKTDVTAKTFNVVVQSAAGVVVGTSLAVASLTDATDVKLALVAVGTTSVDYYVNEIKLGTLTCALPVAALLRPSIQMMNGEAVAKNMQVDYVFCAGER